MKRPVILASIVLTANGCSGPVASNQDLNGCYFAAGPDWIFKISDGRLEDRGGHTLATVSLTRPSRADSVLVLRPGIRLTETPEKSMVVVEGDTQKLLATT